jgi:hypothetical protein
VIRQIRKAARLPKDWDLRSKAFCAKPNFSKTVLLTKPSTVCWLMNGAAEITKIEEKYLPILEDGK